MMIPAANKIDFYKADHRPQYPDGTELVFSNWTPRGSRIPGVNEVVFFGLQAAIQRIVAEWDATFFDVGEAVAVSRYNRRMKNAGLAIDTDHLRSLHRLGHLPMAFYAVPEGTRVPVRLPMFVMWNTRPEHFWLTNYLESRLSNMLWGPCTSATIAARYRDLLMRACMHAGGDPAFVNFQGHDFSYRGMNGEDAALSSGGAHLLSFHGTDTVPAIDWLEDYYDANSDNEMVGGSIPATEHSVMCMGTQAGEIGTFDRLISELYPEGPVSIVSDTWDYWQVITEFLPRLRDRIMARTGGPVVIRPDSGDPVKIICGDPDAPRHTPQWRGTFQCLWEIFGGTVNEKGFKQLDPHIGVIYGDSITYDRADEICTRLIEKGFVPSVVLGIGSFTYQYNTRDTFGFAMKATAGVVNGELREIFKDPKTDSGEKRSARGLLALHNVGGEWRLHQETTWENVKSCAFEPVWTDGHWHRRQTLADIRAVLHPDDKVLV